MPVSNWNPRLFNRPPPTNPRFVHRFLGAGAGRLAGGGLPADIPKADVLYGNILVVFIPGNISGLLFPGALFHPGIAGVCLVGWHVGGGPPIVMAADMACRCLQKFAGHYIQSGFKLDDLLPGSSSFPVTGHASPPGYGFCSQSVRRGDCRGETDSGKFRHRRTSGGHGFRTGNLFLRPTPFGNGLYLHLCVDGVATSRAGDAT